MIRLRKETVKLSVCVRHKFYVLCEEPPSAPYTVTITNDDTFENDLIREVSSSDASLYWQPSRLVGD